MARPPRRRPWRRRFRPPLRDAVTAGELSVSATLNATLARVYLSGEQSVTLGDGLRGVRLGTESLLISSAIEPQVYELDLPGASDEPGHRDDFGADRIPPLAARRFGERNRDRSSTISAATTAPTRPATSSRI